MIERTRAEEKTILEKLEKQLIPIYRLDKGGHDISHPQRMLKIAEKIANPQEVDLFLLKIAILCHDIHRVNGLAPSCREITEITNNILRTLDLMPEEISLIADAVMKHDDLNDDSDSQLLIHLKDADRLDMGAIGILRIASHMSSLPHYNLSDFQKNRKVVKPQEVKSQIDDIKFCLGWEKMLRTPSAKILAKRKFAFMRQFVKEVERELKELELVR